MKTEFPRAIDDVIKMKLKAIDTFMEQFVDPLGDIGNPEKVIGKKYEDWTPMDVQMLRAIYGDNSTVFNNFIFNKELRSIKQLEEA